jgi:hypothetical protein
LKNEEKTKTSGLSIGILNRRLPLAPSIKEFVQYNYFCIQQEIEAVDILNDFLWSSNRRSFDGNLEIKSVTLNKRIYDRIIGIRLK